MLVALITVLINFRGLFCDFSPMDDHIYVLNNVHIRQLDMNLLSWAFTSLPIDLWQPLTWISLALDYRIWGLDPLGYHLTNILFHALNAAFVVLIADGVIRKIPDLKERLGHARHVYPITLLLAGLLFGIHPLRVESVVWITERKDVLNGLFTLSSTWFYLNYAGICPVRRGWFLNRKYLIALLLFALSLMVKPVSVVLPLAFLALDWYPLARWHKGEVRRLVMEKTPFLLLSITVSLMTLYFASENHILRPYNFLSPWQRLTVSGNAIFEYLRLLMVPLGISPLKLIPTSIPLAYTVKSIAVLLFSAFVITMLKRKWLPVTAICFLLPLLPVLALFQNGEQAFAARYTYLPSVAPAIAVAALTGSAYVRLTESRNRFMVRALCLFIPAYLFFYAAMTFYLTQCWDNAETFWTRVLTVDPVAKPYFERGEYYSKVGRFSEAVADYSTAIEKADGDFKRYVYNLYAIRGEALRSLGRYEDAARDYSAAIGMSPHRIYYYSRGQTLQKLGRLREAEADFLIAGAANGSIGFWYTDPSSVEIQKRLAINPDDSEALAARAVSYVVQRNYDAALRDFNRALLLSPDRYSYYWNRSTLYVETGQTEHGLEDCSAALRLNPRHLDSYLRRAAIYAEKGENLRALDDLNVVIGINPSGFEAYANRGLILYRLGRLADAMKDFDAALTLNSGSAETWFNRGLVHSAAGETLSAAEDFRRARELGYK